MDHETDIETLELGVKSAKVASLVGLTQILSLAVGGIMLIVLARLLQPEQYGIYTLAYSVSALFSAFSLSGIGHYLNKYIPTWLARKKRSELSYDLGASFEILAAISLIAMAVGAVFSGVISEYVFHSAAYVNLIYLALASIVFTQLMYLAYNALIGFRDGTGLAFTYFTGTLAIAIASISLVLLGYGVYGAIAGIIVGATAGIATGMFFITRRSQVHFFIDGILERAKTILSFSAPVAGATLILATITNFSVLYLGVFSSAAILGSFGVSYRIGMLATTATGFIGSVLVQMFASALESRNAAKKIRKLYNYSLYFGAAIAAPIAVYLIVFAQAFVDSLFPTYTSSLLYTPTLTVSLLLGTLGVYASMLAISMGKVRKVIKYAAITGAFQIVLALVLIPMLNVYGLIASVYLAGSLLSDYLYMRYMRRELRIRTEFGKLSKVLATSLLLAVLLAPITLIPVRETIQLVIGIVVAVIAYPALLGVTGAMRREERRMLEAMGESTPALRRLFALTVAYISFFSGDSR